MGEAQDKRRPLSGRIFDAVGPNLDCRVRNPTPGECTVTMGALEAILDKLDEAKAIGPYFAEKFVEKRDKVSALERDLDESRANWTTLFARLREVGVHVLPDSTGETAEIDQIVRAVAGLRDDVQSLRDTNEQREVYWSGRLAKVERERNEARANAMQFRDIADSVWRGQSATPDTIRRAENRAIAAEWLAAKNQNERDKARAEVSRLRNAIAHADENARDWQRAESKQREEARRLGARVAELEAEAQALRCALSTERATWKPAKPLPDLEESGDQQPLDTLDDVALALSDIRERLARLEARDA